MLAQSNNGDFVQVAHSIPAMGPCSSHKETCLFSASLLNFLVLFSSLHLFIFQKKKAYISIWQETITIPANIFIHPVFNPTSLKSALSLYFITDLLTKVKS